MKKLGLVGGMGPESTIPYYHDIVYGVQEAMDNTFLLTLVFITYITKFITNIKITSTLFIYTIFFYFSYPSRLNEE